MTEYELYDLLNSSQQTLAAISVAIVTQQSAFVVAMHLVGRKLKAPVFWILLFCYSIYLYGPFCGFQACLQRFLRVVEQLQALNGIAHRPSFFESYFNVSAFIFIWAITIAYAFYIRRQKTD